MLEIAEMSSKVMRNVTSSKSPSFGLFGWSSKEKSTASSTSGAPAMLDGRKATAALSSGEFSASTANATFSTLSSAPLPHPPPTTPRPPSGRMKKDTESPAGKGSCATEVPLRRPGSSGTVAPTTSDGELTVQYGWSREQRLSSNAALQNSPSTIGSTIETSAASSTCSRTAASQSDGSGNAAVGHEMTPIAFSKHAVSDTNVMFIAVLDATSRCFGRLCAIRLAGSGSPGTSSASMDAERLCTAAAPIVGANASATPPQSDSVKAPQGMPFAA